MAGSNPKLAITIIADTAALIKNLEAGRGAIEKYGPTVAKMQEDWKRHGALIIEQAAKVAAAMQGVDAKTLSAADAGKNLKQLETAMSQLARTGQPIPPLFESTAAQLRAVTSASSSFTDKIKDQAIGVAAGLVSVQAFEAGGRKLIDFFRDSIASAAESERTQKRLFVAMTAQGTGAASLVNQYERLAQSTQDVTTFSDEAARELETMLIQVGNVMPDQMAKAVGATTDLASAMGVDLDTAARTMSKAAEGNTTAMRKMGIQLDDTRVKGEGLEYIAGQVEKRFGGQAAAELETYAGKMKQIANRWDDVKENLGNLLIKTIAQTGALDALMVRLRLLNADMSIFKGDNQSAIQGMAAFTLEMQKARKEGESYEAQMLRAYDAGKKVAEAVNTATAKKYSYQYASGAEPGALNVPETIAANAKAQEEAARKLEEAQKKADAAIQAHKAAIQSLADQLSGAAIAVKVLDLAEAFNTLTPAQRASSEVMQRVAKDADALQKEGGKLSPELQRVWRDFVEFGSKVDTSGKSLNEFLKVYGLTAKEMETKPLDISIPGPEKIEKLLASTRAYGKGGLTATEEVKLGIGKVDKGVDELIASLTQLATISGGTFGGMLRGLGTLLSTIKTVKTAADTLNTSTSLSMSSAAAGLGVFAGVVAIVDLAWNLFGDTVNHTQEIIDKSIRDSEALLAAQQALADRTSALFSKYSIVWTELDAAARDNAIWKAVQDLTTDMEYLTRAGVTTEDMLRRTAGAMNELLSKIADAGGEIPAWLVPSIQQMADLGLVTEATMRKMLGMTAPVVVDWKAMSDAAAKYGIDVANLGPKFQQAKLNDVFAGLQSDFELLVNNGADMNSVLDGMAPKVNEAVQSAMKFGSEIPASMKPFIQKLMDAGDLVDENGNKLTDLGALKFATPIEDSMKELVRLFKEFLAKIAEVPGALAKIPKTVPVDIDLSFTKRGGDGTADGAATGGLVTDAGIRYLARGGRVLPFVPKGTDTVPAMLTPGEGVVNTRGMSYLGTGGLAALNHGQAATGTDGGARTMTIQLVIPDGRVLAETVVPWVPGAMKRYGLK